MNRPLLKRSPWHYAEYEDFVEGTNTSTLPPLSFESLRPAVVEEAKKLYAESVTQKDPCRAVELLNRLVFDKRMDSVWAELYKKTRDDDYKATDEFVNPIYVTQASIAASLRKRASDLAERGEDLRLVKILRAEATLLEKEAYDPLAHTRWSGQDLGVQLFLWHIYHAALDPKPEFLSDIKAKAKVLRNVAKVLRAQADKLQSLHIECADLQRLGAEYESKAQNMDVDPKINNP